jgi:hypothetical protein
MTEHRRHGTRQFTFVKGRNGGGGMAVAEGFESPSAPAETPSAGRKSAAQSTIVGIVKLFENTCGSVDVIGLCGGT